MSGSDGLSVPGGGMGWGSGRDVGRREKGISARELGATEARLSSTSQSPPPHEDRMAGK